jgi:hypothetical protein
MPRNEEEVLRNIMSLSRQLRYVSDIPQVIISFDEQKGKDLCFTVILLRVQPAEAPTLQELFAGSKSPLKYIPDRVRRVGHLRKKYVKEATVFRTVVSTDLYLRPDHSVDLIRARQFILTELSALIGGVRDYNGGMIYKQNELLGALRASLGKIADQHNLLLEKFYYSLNPIEMRTSVEVEHLRQLFLLLLQSMRSEFGLSKRGGDYLYKQDSRRALAVVPVDGEKRTLLLEKIEALDLPVHQLVSFGLDTGGNSYAGYLLLSEDANLQKRFLKTIEI